MSDRPADEHAHPIGATVPACSIDSALPSICDVESVLVQLLEHSDQAVKIVDLDGRVLAWNTAAERMYGWTAAEVLGREVPYLSDTQRMHATQLFRHVAASGADVRRIPENRRKDGSVFGADTVIVPLHDRSGDACAVMTVATLATDDSRFGSQADIFLDAVARELTAPLAALQGAAQLMVTPSVAEDPERRKRVAQIVHERCQQISALTEDLMVSASIRHGVLTLEPQSVDLAKMVGDAVEQTCVGKREGAIDVSVEPELPLIEADRGRLEQALTIMLTIALEDTESGTASVSVHREGTCAVVFAGEAAAAPGADAGEHASRSVDRPVIGPGARLRAIEQIAVAHGGSFVVKRRIRGSVLILRLPLPSEKAGR